MVLGVGIFIVLFFFLMFSGGSFFFLSVVLVVDSSEAQQQCKKNKGDEMGATAAAKEARAQPVSVCCVYLSFAFLATVTSSSLSQNRESSRISEDPGRCAGKDNGKQKTPTGTKPTAFAWVYWVIRK